MCDGTGAEDDLRSGDDADGMGESWVERKTLTSTIALALVCYSYCNPSQPSSISQTERNENESKTTKVLHILSTSILLRYIGVWHRSPGRIRPMHLYWGFWTRVPTKALLSQKKREGRARFGSLEKVRFHDATDRRRNLSPLLLLSSSTSLPASTKSSNRKAVAAPASPQGRAGTKKGIEDVLVKAFGGVLRGLQNLRSENLRIPSLVRVTQSAYIYPYFRASLIASPRSPWDPLHQTQALSPALETGTGKGNGSNEIKDDSGCFVLGRNYSTYCIKSSVALPPRPRRWRLAFTRTCTKPPTVFVFTPMLKQEEG
ncbi:hypothetical protein BT96DRAFT_971293 [Gymnopus androsaceus JB14]|uniref:Uncharacterized protein n=1 Tax=Gymnopus androsaceus JB14 TaxID=1447944 RepID=A0A6A4I6J5_9AGAR|nr:hypothetical protein BT96DRAFT_971293 [Gymnopus androsaceus JB14]